MPITLQFSVWQPATARGTVASNSGRNGRARVMVAPWECSACETALALIGERKGSSDTLSVSVTPDPKRNRRY